MSVPEQAAYADEKASSTKGEDAGGGIVVFEDSLKDMYYGEESGVDPVYYAKARILNSAMQEIGMGKYQVRLIRRGIISISD